MNVGIIGCGNISETYFNSQKFFKNLNIVACSDIDNNFQKVENEYNIKS